MADLASVSSNQLKNRRQDLQNQRRFRALQAVWRFIAIAGMAGGLLWILTLPHWTIGKESQVIIEGNRLLSGERIRQLLPLSKSHSVWQLPTQQILTRLEATPPIANAQITRQIFPPKLIVEITEREPVAVAISDRDVGFVDEQGIFIPKNFYDGGDKNWQPPTLKVIGYDPLYRQHWTQLYKSIGRSPIAVKEIDWHNPSNLILKTEMGVIYFGAYNKELFLKQLSVLARMQKLPSRVSAGQITYIDLTNPDLPTVQLKLPKKLILTTLPSGTP
ncbi:FtsQ-type POTRA domain-containing protein [Candidatus Gracilibacteria bacterium]|nr:FtsQ-type POTRA domain-containing protein [Candidatus Gracilibacteria bacterium]NJM87993.1 FtsQ-type POTRA domain-containing protein [Hydrococcus sp. RU_2_2]NJP20600.1 FtsQ-type POTRA domain-containing protein [Hydrococcus sp. CRU_1_1]